MYNGTFTLKKHENASEILLVVSRFNLLPSVAVVWLPLYGFVTFGAPVFVSSHV